MPTNPSRQYDAVPVSVATWMKCCILVCSAWHEIKQLAIEKHMRRKGKFISAEEGETAGRLCRCKEWVTSDCREESKTRDGMRSVCGHHGGSLGVAN